MKTSVVVFYSFQLHVYYIIFSLTFLETVCLFPFSWMFYFKGHNVHAFVLERIIIDSVKLTYISEK